MRWSAGGQKPLRLLAVLAAAAGLTALLLVPADSGAAGGAGAAGAADGAGPSRLAAGRDAAGVADPSHGGQAFGGVAAVGALFSENSGQLGAHFCTATVVHSPHGDLAVTAAHCLSGTSGPIAFVPGYANGQQPFGIWQVTRVYTDEAWQSAQDPDHDVAFLRVSPASDGTRIEDVTGAVQLGTGWAAPALVHVIGYPDSADQPVLCANWTKSFSPTQLEFDCGGYTVGTSGGPFLAGLSGASGQGTVIGVIGGYQQGGDTPQVSYSAVFGAAVAVLFETAEAGG
jgi:V8-like Glu-specific endopeptidase